MTELIYGIRADRPANLVDPTVQSDGSQILSALALHSGARGAGIYDMERKVVCKPEKACLVFVPAAGSSAEDHLDVSDLLAFPRVSVLRFMVANTLANAMFDRTPRTDLHRAILDVPKVDGPGTVLDRLAAELGVGRLVLVDSERGNVCNPETTGIAVVLDEKGLADLERGVVPSDWLFHSQISNVYQILQRESLVRYLRFWNA